MEKETIEEALNSEIKLVHDVVRNKDFDLGFQTGGIFGAKWQQEQDKNKYSEEEVLIILDKFLTSMIKGEKTGLLEEWFEQFKKK